MWYYIGYNPLRIFSSQSNTTKPVRVFGSISSSFLSMAGRNTIYGMGSPYLASLKTFHLFRVWDVQMSFALSRQFSY